MNYTAKQIASIVQDTLDRTMKIAQEQGATAVVNGTPVITLAVLEALHKSVANNLGHVLAEAMGDANL